MSLSDEMTHYITTGRCPRCDVIILDPDSIRSHSVRLKNSAEALANADLRRQKDITDITEAFRARIRPLPLPVDDLLQRRRDEMVIAPLGVKVRVEYSMMRCLKCRSTWSIAELQHYARPEVGGQRLDNYQIAPRAFPGSPQQLRPVFGAKPPPLVREVDLTGCRVIGVMADKKVETPLPVERREYPNNSSAATLTVEVGISNSITMTVTTEASRVKAHNAQAGVTILGFTAIQAQVQRELSERYAVNVENTFTVSEKLTVEVPPSTTVELLIHWMTVSWNGIAILGKPSSPTSSFAEVPYSVPARLTYTEELNDVPRSKNRNI
jgi:hypothetical protein